MAKTILAWNERAQQYQREIGKLPTSGKPHRFYLTDDERVARANVVRPKASGRASRIGGMN